MNKRLISIIGLIGYTLLLIKVMVFKDVPLIKIGQLMLNFGGTDASGSANFIPFKTILPYLFGSGGLIIGGINLIGNIILLVPIGFMVPFIYKRISWIESIILAIASGLFIEVMQVILRVGIFDIDDVILNAFGVIIGYGMFKLLQKWVRERKYLTIVLVMILSIVTILAVLYLVYPKQGTVTPDVQAKYVQSESANNPEAEIPKGVDLCGGTGGNGEIIKVADNAITLKLKNGKDQLVYFGEKLVIESTTGNLEKSDLEIGDLVTLIGGPNPDGSFTADNIVLCSITDPEASPTP